MARPVPLTARPTLDPVADPRPRLAAWADRRDSRGRRVSVPIGERLAAGSAHRPNGCIEWTGARNRDGYGLIWLDGANRLAHRVAYEAARGPLGVLSACHTCDNPPCVNVDHLFAGTQADNNHDMRAKHRARNHRRGNPKLTRDQVDDIRGCQSPDGPWTTATRMAPGYGVGVKAVYEILTGRTWQ